MIRPGVNLVYVSYDKSQDILDVFEDESDDELKMIYKNCVILDV